MLVLLLTRGHLSVPRWLIALHLRDALAEGNPLALCCVLNCERTLSHPSCVHVLRFQSPNFQIEIRALSINALRHIKDLPDCPIYKGKR